MSNLPSLDPVRAEVNALATGRRKTRFLTVFGQTLAWAAIAWAIAAFFVDPAVTGLLALAVVAAALLAGAAAASLVPVDEVAVAKRYDDLVGTKDLLSSSLELDGGADPRQAAFVAAVREDAARATGRAGERELYPRALPRHVRLVPLAVVAALAGAFVRWQAMPEPDEISPAVAAALKDSAAWIEDLANRDKDQPLSELRADAIERMKSLAEVLRKEDTDKLQAMAELARLASQLDKERKDLEARKLELEKNAAKLARGEDMQDARRDMDAGRYREAANKVKKKIEDLEKKLKEAIEKKAGKLEIEKLQKEIDKLKELLAELEQLDALGHDLGFLVETLEALERIEGELGELGEFDGQEFDEAQVGRMRKPQPGEPQDSKRLLVAPSSDAGHGHVKKVLGAAKRALSEGEEHEARLRESKGQSSFGQVKTANDGSRSRTEFQERLLAAKRAADDVIYRQNIPVAYRTYIRRYFEAVQPDERTAPGEDR
jgi:hypothetical protein